MYSSTYNFPKQKLLHIDCPRRGEVAPAVRATAAAVGPGAVRRDWGGIALGMGGGHEMLSKTHDLDIKRKHRWENTLQAKAWLEIYKQVELSTQNRNWSQGRYTPFWSKHFANNKTEEQHNIQKRSLSVKHSSPQIKGVCSGGMHILYIKLFVIYVTYNIRCVTYIMSNFTCFSYIWSKVVWE